MTRTRRRLSLRSRVIAGGSALALTVVVSAVVLFSIGNTAWTSQQTAVSDFMEEQRIGDEINRRVTAQLAAITGLAPGSGPSLPPAFEAAGDQVQTQLRLYLFRDLTPDERLQLETIGQAHRHLEVAAFRASELAFLGREEEALEARQALFASAESFLVATEGFLALRQAGFERLQERQEATLQVIRLLAGGVAAMALLGTLFLVLLLARRVVTPLEELASASRTISEGDFSVRVREEGMDREFHTVAHAFNEMAKNLRTTTRRLESRNEELGQALKTIQQTQGELIQSEKLGAMGRMTAGLAHELNNPLASVLGYAQMLQQDIQDQASMDTGHPGPGFHGYGIPGAGVPDTHPSGGGTGAASGPPLPGLRPSGEFDPGSGPPPFGGSRGGGPSPVLVHPGRSLGRGRVHPRRTRARG